VERAEAEAILDGDRETAVALLMRVDELVEANRRLEARVGELEQRLSRSSRNSSLPPSQDPPSAPPRPRTPASGRRPGGQPGHEGRNRRLLPLEQLDEVVEHWPARCARCAHPFGESERIEAASPQRHQVSELPVIAVTVTEHRLHRLRCPECAAETRAGLPTDVPRGAFGPRLQATVTTLAVRNRVSRRDSAELVRELFGVELATGSVDAIVQRVGETLAEPHARLAEQIRSAAVVNIDETGWRTAGERRTLWGAWGTKIRLVRPGASELVRGRRVGFFCTRVEGGCFLVVSLLYLLFRRALAVAALRLRSREFKELEIVVLRHELAVLRRQVSRPRLDERDRVFLAAASRLLNGKSQHSFFVRPVTRCWAGIASLYGDGGRTLDGDRVGRRCRGRDP